MTVEKLSEIARMNKLNQKVEKVIALDKVFAVMSDEQLKQKSSELVSRRKNGESENKLIYESFALVREATWRTLGMKQYPVQIKGGISIAEGNLAEMATGEGKTIVVPLVAYLHALSGENVHIITSNEYLASRDSEQMSKLFGFLGMKVGLSLSGMDIEQKQEAYSCNITYTTASELGFDYLRDNNSPYAEQKVLRGLNSIVIDEADHTLLDEASTPHILSVQESISQDEQEFLRAVAHAIDTLEEGVDYEVEPDNFFAALSESGIKKLENFFRIDSMFCDENISLFGVCNNALKAKTLYIKDVNYVVKNGKIEIVGESIGRILEGRQYSHGIHQAIEAKEGVKNNPYSKTTSNINFQNFFRLYKNLGGMSGTCKTDEEELQATYGIRVDKIETNKPVIRKDEHFRFYHTLDAKEQALKERILELHRSGRPILLGTTSIENSINLAHMLNEMGLEYNLLNAINEEEEGKIIAQAGRLGAITIATNMAGRGTDIKLGGNPTEMAKDDMKKLGFSSALISFADSHLQPTTQKQQEARKIFDELKAKHKMTTDAEKNKVLECGGLAVIGTALNTSRRVDNQLRGRAGRQGEPGSSEFFVAWDDIKDTMKPSKEVEELYEEQIKKLIKKKSVDPTKEIGNKNIIEFVENIQLLCEANNQTARHSNFQLNTPENMQRAEIDYQKQNIIKICDEFEPFLVEISPEPKTELEKYMKAQYHDEISSIVKEWFDAKKHCKDKTNAENGDIVRKKLGKFLFNPKVVTDEFLNSNSPDEITEKLSNFALKLFQRSIIETRELAPEIGKTMKVDMINKHINFWDDHIERLDKAKFQYGLSSMTQNPNAIFNYIKDSANAFQQYQSRVRSEIISSTTEYLTRAVEAIRNFQQDKQMQGQARKNVVSTLKAIVDDKTKQG